MSLKKSRKHQGFNEVISLTMTWKIERFFDKLISLNQSRKIEKNLYNDESFKSLGNLKGFDKLISLTMSRKIYYDFLINDENELVKKNVKIQIK